MSAGRRQSDAPFLVALAVLGGSYVVLIVAMLLADLAFTSPWHLLEALPQPELQRVEADEPGVRVQ